MSEENKGLVRRFYEAYPAGDVAALDDVVSALDDIVAVNFVSHQNSSPEPIVGLESVAQHLASWAAAKRLGVFRQLWAPVRPFLVVKDWC